MEVSTAFGVNMLKDTLASKGLIEAREAGEIAELLNNAITQSRDLARGLYPVRLEEEGLSSALEELAENVTRNSEISCRVESNRPIQVYDALVGSNLYRLAQEAVTNAVKHGRPKSIVIRLEQQGTITTLTIVNDGKSYAGPETRDRGMGLRIMKYRARMIGAD